MDGNRHSYISSRILRSVNLLGYEAIPVSDLRKVIRIYGDITDNEFDENLKILIDEGLLKRTLDINDEPAVRMTCEGIRFLWWNG